MRYLTRRATQTGLGGLLLLVGILAAAPGRPAGQGASTSPAPGVEPVAAPERELLNATSAGSNAAPPAGPEQPGASGPAPAGAALGEPVLGRFPTVTEGGRKLARVTLKGLLSLVMERNLAIQATQVSQDASRQTLRAAQQRLQPTFTSSFGYTRTVQPGFSSSAPSAGTTQGGFLALVGQNATTFTAGISQQDWLGITYALNYQVLSAQFQNMLVQQEGDPPQTGPLPNYKDYSTLSGSVTIPLAQNAGRDFNRIPVGQAEVGLRISRLSTRKQELTTLNAVGQAYWNLVGQLETVAVNEEAVRLDTRLLNDNRIRLQAGTIAPADVLASETQLARDQQSLLQARLAALNFEDQLRQAIGLVSVDFGFKPEDSPSLREPGYDPEAELDRVYRNNPDLATLLASLENNGYDLRNAENAARPQFNLGLSYNFNGYSQAHDQLQGSAYYSYQQTQGYAATLSYSVPLFDKVGPANIQRRLLERQALDLQIRDQRTSLNIQLQTALRNIRQAQEQVTTARTAVDLAKVQLKNEIDKLAHGRSTAFTVAQVQQQLFQAQQQEIAARVQSEQNDITRLALTGELYGAFGLQSQAIDPQ